MPGPSTQIPAIARIEQLQRSTQAPDSAHLQRVVIVGGGSAGWMAAAALSKVLDRRVAITLVDAAEIGTVGVGEATIPTIQLLHQMMGVDEQDFLSQTQGTFKLGIDFVDWGRQGHRYFHPFGRFGRDFDAQPVHQHWLKHRHQPGMGALEDYSLGWQAARLGRFALPGAQSHPLAATFNYAYHFDASLYARYLRGLSLERGVVHTEGRIVDALRHADTGFVTAVVLADGRQVAGDLFIDCSGFAALLVGQALGVGYESWARWLPCDRAVAMPCSREAPPLPYTRSTALQAGWQWTIGLRHRIGNGYVFSSALLSQDEAAQTLASRLPGAAQAEPRLLKFTPGRRHRAWDHNVVALGLASGFLEPLESTSLHLVHAGLQHLLSLFPDKTCQPVLRQEYNRRFSLEMERIRDFLILHYKLNSRSDSELWRYCAHMDVPGSLQERMDLFRHGGYVQTDGHDLFGTDSWLAVHLGQLNFPQSHSSLLDSRRTQGQAALHGLRQALEGLARTFATHEAFLQAHLQGQAGPLAQGVAALGPRT